MCRQSNLDGSSETSTARRYAITCVSPRPSRARRTGLERWCKRHPGQHFSPSAGSLGGDLIGGDRRCPALVGHCFVASAEDCATGAFARLSFGHEDGAFGPRGPSNGFNLFAAYRRRRKRSIERHRLDVGEASTRDAFRDRGINLSSIKPNRFGASDLMSNARRGEDNRTRWLTMTITRQFESACLILDTASPRHSRGCTSMATTLVIVEDYR